VPRGVEVIPLDLASLDSVRGFADAVTRQLKGAGYLAAWNAGTRVRRSSPATSRICRPRYLANWPFIGHLSVELAIYPWTLQT
jgi:hypothetical protein